MERGTPETTASKLDYLQNYGEEEKQKEMLISIDLNLGNAKKMLIGDGKNFIRIHLKLTNL